MKAGRTYWSFLCVTALCLLLCGDALALSVSWTDPSGNLNISPDDANAKTYRASVTCVDHDQHTYSITVSITGPNGASTSGVSYATADNFVVTCGCSGIGPSSTYTFRIRVEETDTGLVATDTFALTTPSIWVTVDWNGHPGATMVLNNGAFGDYLWGDEQGSGWPFWCPNGAWGQSGSNAGSDPLQSYYDNYTPAVANVGSNTVTLNYSFDNGVTVSDDISFTVAQEVQGVVVNSTSHPQLDPKVIREFGPYPLKADITGTLEGSVTKSWSTTKSNSNRTSTEHTEGTECTATASGDIEVLSLSASIASQMSTTVTNEVATTTSKTLTHSGTASAAGAVQMKDMPAGKILRWYSHIATDRVNFTVSFYKDLSPRDGFPDVATIAQITDSITKIVGLGCHASFVN